MSHAGLGWLVCGMLVFGMCASAMGQGFSVWPADPMEKIFRDSKPPDTLAKALQVQCARNEYESAQLGITAVEDLADVALEVSDLVAEGTGAKLPAGCVQWNFVGFIPIAKNTPNTVPEELIRQAPFDVPDPLLAERTMTVKAGQTQPVWLTIRVPADAMPGKYLGKITVKTSKGNAEVPVELTVFSFALPDERHLLVTNWFDAGGIAKTHGVKPLSEDFWALLEKYARNMAEHRQNVFMAPWPYIKVTRAADGKLTFDYSDFDHYVETFLNAGVKDRIEIGHVAHFGKDGWSGTDIVLAKIGVKDPATGKTVALSPEEGLAPLLADLEKHLAERGWLDKAMIHIADEPSAGNIAAWKKASQFVHKAAPKLRRIDAIEGTGFETDLEVCVPKLSHLRNWFDDFKRAQAGGAELWYYICCHPTGFYPNRFLDFSLAKVRLLHWINWRYDVPGYLHWGLTYWGKEPFGTPPDNLPPGDTHVLYPGKNGPLSSIRWETQRDSLEDYEYLWLLTERMKEAQKRLGPGAARLHPEQRAHEIALGLVRDFDDFTHNPADIHAARAAVAQEIETALEPPLLMVETKPIAGTRLVPGPISVELFGAVEKGTTVKLNNHPLNVAEDGSFARSVWLGTPNKGITTVTITIEAERDGKKKSAVRQYPARTK